MRWTPYRFAHSTLTFLILISRVGHSLESVSDVCVRVYARGGRDYGLLSGSLPESVWDVSESVQDVSESVRDFCNSVRDLSPRRSH